MTVMCQVYDRFVLKPERKRGLYEVFAIVGALVVGGIDGYQKQPAHDPRIQQNLQNLGTKNLEHLFNIQCRLSLYNL